MLTSQQVKQYAKESGADLVGIAPMDRFEGAPKQADPRYIFPDATAMIVLGFRIPRGCLRGIEEGTFYVSYCGMGYAGINFVLQPMVIWRTVRMLEDEGYEAVPIQNNFPWCHMQTQTGELRPQFSRPVAPDRPAPDVFVHLRIAAVAAGLGEIGYGKVFLSPEFGPRQRLACIITDAPLEPDPLFEGDICDRCMQCVRDCTADAISETETVEVNVAGKQCEWGKLDVERCKVGFQWPEPEHNPFLVEPSPTYFYGRALEGARGCIRACMVRLEEEGRISKTFRNPFRKRKPWRIQ
ncbi:MAG: hypothetical protein PVH68_21000 [Armatimonadota bacterium]|jgi:hypothetical protein